MKKNNFYFLSILFFLIFMECFSNQKLPSPDFKDSFLKILLNRKSSRDFNKNLHISNQDLSNILWSAFGINRKNENKRVIPTALNKQDIEIYVVKKDSTYLYNVEKNELIVITKENLFPYFSNFQKFIANADIILLYTSKNFDKKWSQLHTGSAYQNVAVYCSEKNIKNVVVGYYNKDISKKINVKEENIIIAQVIGY